MHAIIAAEVAEKREETEMETFIIGGLAPNAASDHVGKSQLHYYQEDQDGTLKVKFAEFARQHMDLSQASKWRGYATHLVADHVWLSTIYNHWLHHRVTSDPSQYDAFYRDFMKLNQPLLTEFGKAPSDFEWLKNPPNVQFSNIPQAQLTELLLQTSKDAFSDASSDLEVLTWKGVVDYINVSVEQSLAYLRGL